MDAAQIERKTFWRRLLVVGGLGAVSFVAPVLDIYGRNPEVFVANRTGRFEILLFGLVVSLLVPVLATLVLWVAGRIGADTYDIAFKSLVVLLAIATGLVISRQVVPDANLVAPIVTIAVAVVVVAMVRRFEGIVAWFSLALPLVVVMFAATSPSARLIWTAPEGSEVSVLVGNPAPIVFVQLDEMPIASIMTLDGGINKALFPSFARLAEEGTWYRNALSDSIATTQSVPAILTGTRGEKGMSPSSVDYPDNLFTMLGGAYEMHVIEWVADLCPDDVCPEFAGRAPARFSALLQDVGVVYGHLTMPPAVRDQLPSIDNAWKGFLGQNDRPVGTSVEIDGLSVPPHGKRAAWVEHVQRIIDGLGPGGRPTLSYAHLQAPHVPWETNPSGTHYERPEEYTEVEGVEGDGRWGPSPDPALMGFQRHLNQTGFLDLMLGRLFAELDRTGSWEETMVIVVADHGASFVPGEHRRWPYEDNRDDLYRVPLFIKYPGQVTGEVRDEATFGIDILPSIVDALDVATNWAFDGTSLLEVAGTDRAHQPIWWCCNGDGVSTDLAVLFDQVERNHQWVPDQASWAGVAAVGADASLVGQSVTALAVLENQDVKWSLDNSATLSSVDIGSGFVQTLLTGRIELPEDVDSDRLLVVVNGRVAGVGFLTRDSADGGSLRAFVAEDLVSEGPNDIDLLVHQSANDTWVSGTAGVITLDLFAADGRRLDVRAEGSRRIQVDKVAPTADGWTVTGWAADVSRKETPDTVYVFAGDSLLASGPPNEDNANVVRWFDSQDLLRSGFVFEIEASDVPTGIEQLTVVAEFGSYAVADPARLTG